jgi:hypothetical protein
MKIIISENQFNTLWFRRRTVLIKKIVDKHLIDMGRPPKDSMFGGRDDYYDEIIRRVISDLTNNENLTLGQYVFIKDLIRTNFGNRIEYFHHKGELF